MELWWKGPTAVRRPGSEEEGFQGLPRMLGEGGRGGETGIEDRSGLSWHLQQRAVCAVGFDGWCRDKLELGRMLRDEIAAENQSEQKLQARLFASLGASLR